MRRSLVRIILLNCSAQTCANFRAHDDDVRCVNSLMISTTETMTRRIAHEKFVNFAGQPCARLNCDQRIYKKPQHIRSALIIVLSPLLFFSPEPYLAMLHGVWVDDRISPGVWRNLTPKLVDEWKDFILYSTVLCKLPEFR
jgi:hypothetical protein